MHNDNLPNKIIQKDVTFHMNLVTSIFTSDKVLSKMKKDYGAILIKKSWHITSPFNFNLLLEVNIDHSVDITKMRKTQHDLTLQRDKINGKE